MSGTRLTCEELFSFNMYLCSFYIHRWADRDMVFRYCGLGVGHRSTWEATRMFREDICRAFNLSEDVFDMGGDIEMSEDTDLEEEEDSSEEDDLVDEEAEVADSEGEAEINDGSDNEDEWETDSEVEEDEEDEELDEEADAELDDICDDDDNEVGLEPDLGFAAL